MTDEQRDRLGSINKRLRENISEAMTYENVLRWSWSAYLAMLAYPAVVKRAKQTRRSTVRHLAKHLGHKLTEQDVIKVCGPVDDDLREIIRDDLEELQKPVARGNQAKQRSDKLTRILKSLS